MTAYLLRVKPTANGYTCTLRQLAGGQHPDDLAVTDVVATGVAESAPAAMVAAICNAHIPLVPSEPRKGGYAC